MFTYRAKRKDNGEMVEGWYVWVKENLLDNFPDAHDFIIPAGLHPDAGIMINIDPITLSMSTGKTDKNGKMIFGSIPLEDGTMTKGGDRVRETIKGTKLYVQEVFWAGDTSQFALRPSSPFDYTGLCYSEYRVIIGTQLDKDS